MFYQLFQALFGVDPRPEPQAVTTTPVNKEKVNSVSLSDNQFDSDIERLESAFGRMKTGLCIDTTLQNLLTICPRKRERTDAYNGLVKYLKDEYGVILTITSRKHKK